MPRLLNRADVGYGFPTPTAGDRGAGQQAVWDAVQALGVQTGTTTTVTSSRSLTMSDCGSVLIDATVGNITLTLPQSGTSTDNACFTFVRLDASANAVTIQRASSDTIEGVISIGITLGQRRSITIPAGTTVWRVVGDSLGIVPLLPFLQNYLRSAADITASGTTLTIPATQSASNDNVAMMTVGTTFTKTTAIFAIGTGLGGLDSGAVTVFTDYFLYQVRNPSTGVVDYTFSTNSSAPAQTGNLAGFTQSRRLPVLLRTGATATQWSYVLNMPPAGAIKTVQTIQTINLAGLAQQDLFLPFDAFDAITIRAEGLRLSANADHSWRLLNNATAYLGANDYYSSYTLGSSSLTPTANAGGAGGTLGQLLGTHLNGSSNTASFIASLMSPKETGSRLQIIAEGYYVDASLANFVNIKYTSEYAGVTSGLNAARTGIRIFLSAGTWVAGKLIISGVPK